MPSKIFILLCLSWFRFLTSVCQMPFSTADSDNVSLCSVSMVNYVKITQFSWSLSLTGKLCFVNLGIIAVTLRQLVSIIKYVGQRWYQPWKCPLLFQVNCSIICMPKIMSGKKCHGQTITGQPCSKQVFIAEFSIIVWYQPYGQFTDTPEQKQTVIFFWKW